MHGKGRNHKSVKLKAKGWYVLILSCYIHSFSISKIRQYSYLAKKEDTIFCVACKIALYLSLYWRRWRL